MSTAAQQHGSELARTMGLASLVIYGVGDMLGSGVYGLIGKAADQMGNAVWLSFAVSMVAALLTGLSYACLGSRYPRAAGAAFITQRAFGRPLLAYLVGLAVMASGLTSMATACRVFAEYFQALVGGPTWLIVLGFVGLLTAINLRGMKESMWMNAVCTTIELGGLLLIIVVGLRFLGGVDYLDLTSTQNPAGDLSAALLLNGAVLTFYSFIGFEDMLNVAEEVKDPRRALPLGMLLAIAIATVVYILISLVAVSVVPHGELAASKEPLVDVVRRAAPWFPPLAFTAIALYAVANTALLNYIMGSRLAYGMARQGLLPAALGRVHPRRQTPYVAIYVLMAIVIVLALTGDISRLARATAVLLLFVFVLVNASLLALGRRAGEPKGLFDVPRFVPVGGIVVCVLMLAHASAEAWKIAGGMLLGILVLYAILRPRQAVIEEEGL